MDNNKQLEEFFKWLVDWEIAKSGYKPDRVVKTFLEHQDTEEPKGGT
ncbi:hypothetical protein CCP3SC15_4970001 [Gammaproteobacteria bacterium]